MKNVLFVLLLCAVSYLAGSIPFGLLYGRIFKGIDIRNFGSGNIGATNVRRLFGFKAFIVVLFLDGLKGFIPVLLSWKLSNVSPKADEIATVYAGLYSLNGLIPMAIGLCCIAGHVKSVFIKFTGGKAVATSMGVLLAIVPLPALSGIAVWIVTVLITKYVSLGSILGVLSINIFTWCLPGNALTVYSNVQNGMNFAYIKIMLAIILVLVVVTHIPNINRLIQGREHKFGEKVEIK